MIAAPLIFALDKDDGGVHAFASAAGLAAHCKGVDVRDGFWLFYADDGSPLEARFERPDTPDDPELVTHVFSLQRAMSGRWLQERLAQVTTVSGCGLSSVDELAEVLKINRGKRIPPAAKRG